MLAPKAVLSKIFLSFFVTIQYNYHHLRWPSRFAANMLKESSKKHKTRNDEAEAHRKSAGKTPLKYL